VTVQDNKALARRFWEEFWNQRNLAAVDEIVAPNFVLYTPSGPINGPEGLKGYARTILGVSSDVQFTLDDIIAEGDKVVTRWSGRGSHTGSFAGRPPTGKRFTMTGISIFRIENDKIVEDRVAEDTFGFLQQLGVIPVPEQAGR
jgi:predicted ester cyclase